MGASVLFESGDMQGNGLKGIIAGIILVVLCFIVGAQAAESAVSSAAIIAAVVGALVLILMGKRCWWLIFLLGPVVDVLPLPGPLSTIPGGMYMAAAVLVYWLLLWGMGYVKIKWRSFLLLDLLVLALAICVVAAYIRRPVSINYLGFETDTQGGADYVYYAVAFVYYLTLSCIPMEKGELAKVLRWSVAVVLGALFVDACMVLVSGGIHVSELDSLRTESLFFFGEKGMAFLWVRFSFLAIILNPFLVGIALMLCGCVLLSGGRERFMVVFCTIANIAIIKKEILSCVCVGGVALFGLYMLSAAGFIEQAPHSVQRIVSMLPGIEISRAAKTDTEGTWEWRLTIWDMALDKRAGYIEDYVFGDGYGISVAEHSRLQRGVMRGQIEYADLEAYAIMGIWHNGAIRMLNYLGYVGLTLVVLILIVGSVYMFRVCFALRGSPLFFPIVFYVSNYAALIPEYCLGAHGDRQFILQFVSLALIKWAYCMLREEDKLIPLWQRKRYVPQMIREYGGELCHSKD